MTKVRQSIRKDAKSLAISRDQAEVIQVLTHALAKGSDDDQLLLPVEAGAFLSCSAGKLKRWRLAGAGPAVTWLGPRSARYRLGDLRSWIRAQRKDGS